MLDKDYCDLVEECIKKSKAMADAYIKKHIDPIADLGNPERIIGKPYERWTPMDKQMLRQAYTYTPEKLEEFMAKKDIDGLFHSIRRTKAMGV